MLKEIKWNSILLAVFYIALGVILVLYPDTTARMIVYISAGTIMVIGLFTILSYFFKDIHVRYYKNDFVVGFLEIILGAFAIYKLDLVMDLIPIILGIFVVVSGLGKFQAGLDIGQMGYKSWIPFIIIAIVNIAFGAVLIYNPFVGTQLLFLFIGAGLIFSGVMDLILTFALSKKLSDFIKEMGNKTPVDPDAVANPAKSMEMDYVDLEDLAEKNEDEKDDDEDEEDDDEEEEFHAGRKKINK